jgi:hypothetical protein
MELKIYFRPGCHLCEDMTAIVQRVIRAAGRPATIAEVDISGDADLEARYGAEIPVLEIDGRKIAKYRITDGELRRALDARRDR